MADNTINVKLKQRYDTENNWATKNPVLLAGEMAISSDKDYRYKVGNGTAKWSELSYAKARLEKSDVTTALGYTPPTTNTTYNDVTQSTHGLMSSTDKTKLDGIATGANKYSHPIYTAKSNGLYKVTVDGTGHVSATTAVTKADITGLGIPASDTNTWRGIQNNLTSDSTTDSLSAAQGKWLNNNKLGSKQWTATIKCATWSRICYVPYKTQTTGSSFILNVSATRTSVVYHDTFAIKLHHYDKAQITKISGSAYGSSIQIRVICDTDGNGYVELYDNANSATNSQTQTVACNLIDVSAGSITTYTSFTDGTTIPSGFQQGAILKTNTNSLQGNLTWGEITSKPSFATVATSGSYNDLSNKPTIGNGTVTIKQAGTSKGTFTMNQSGNTTIALTDNDTQWLIDTTGKTIIIGDSYTEGYTPAGNITPWTTNFLKYTGITDYQIAKKGGSGFAVTNNTFKALLDSVASSTSVKNIIVVGGYNEPNSYDSIVSAIQTFYDDAKTKFPNARIFLAMAGWSAYSEQWDRLTTVARAYSKQIKDIVYLNGVEYALHADGFVSTDGFHPNATGQERLANAMAEAVKSGSCTNKYGSTNVRIKWGSNFKLSSGATWTMLSDYDNNKSRIIWSDTSIYPSSNKTIVCDGTEYLICAIDGTSFVGDSNGYTCFPDCVIIHSSRGYEVVQCQYRWHGRDLYMAFYGCNDSRNNYLTLSSVDQIQIHRGSMVW